MFSSSGGMVSIFAPISRISTHLLVNPLPPTLIPISCQTGNAVILLYYNFKILWHFMTLWCPDWTTNIFWYDGFQTNTKLESNPKQRNSIIQYSGSYVFLAPQCNGTLKGWLFRFNSPIPSSLRKDIVRKSTFSFGHCPKRGGGYPCPNFLALFSPS